MGLTPENAFGCLAEFVFPPKSEIYRRAIEAEVADPAPIHAMNSALCRHLQATRTCAALPVPWLTAYAYVTQSCGCRGGCPAGRQDYPAHWHPGAKSSWMIRSCQVTLDRPPQSFQCECVRSCAVQFANTILSLKGLGHARWFLSPPLAVSVTTWHPCAGSAG